MFDYIRRHHHVDSMTDGFVGMHIFPDPVGVFRPEPFTRLFDIDTNGLQTAKVLNKFVRRPTANVDHSLESFTIANFLRKLIDFQLRLVTIRSVVEIDRWLTMFIARMYIEGN